MPKGKKLKSKSNVKPEEKLAEGNVEAMPEEAKSESIQSEELGPEGVDSSNELPKEEEQDSKEQLDKGSEDIEQKGKGVIEDKLESTPEAPKAAASPADESNAEDTEEDDIKVKEIEPDTKRPNAPENRDLNDDDESGTSGTAPVKKEANRKKSVGFAPAPEEDLKEHHDVLKKKEEQKRKGNSFHNIPPELSYLQKKPDAPKPLHSSTSNTPPSSRRRMLKELGDLRNMPIKEISLQNKETELNFNYPTVHLPIRAHHMLVDTKFGSLNSFDLAKVNNYILNLSDTKVGLGYEFSGKVIEVGAKYQSEFAVGDNVFGCTNSLSRKGALSTSLLINPTKDVLISVDDKLLEKLGDVDIELSFKNAPEDGNFEISSTSSSSLDSEPIAKQPTNLHNKLAGFTLQEELSPLAKLSTFPVLYCRAKQALDHSNAIFESTGKANILINGADTNLGFTILQLLNSSAYSAVLNEMNLILTIREKSFDKMTNLVNHFTKGKYFDPSRRKRIHLVTFDMENEDLVLPGEKVPMNYKKPELFASDVLNALFGDAEEQINKDNAINHKLDLIIDLVGCKKFLQTLSIRYKKLETLSLPYLSKFSSDSSLSQVLKANTKEPFLMKLLKPKSYGSCFVSCCKFNLSFPSYNIDELFDYSTNNVSLNPWSMKWSSSLANSLTNYYYFEELSLRIKKAWILEGLNLLVEDELKFRIDDFIDWRNNFKKCIKSLKKDDGKVVFKIEDF